MTPDDEVFVEAVVSHDGKWKAEIRRRNDGLYHVVLLRWMDDRALGGPTAEGWVDAGPRSGATVTDSIELARSLASERLRSVT